MTNNPDAPSLGGEGITGQLEPGDKVVIQEVGFGVFWFDQDYAPLGWHDNDTLQFAFSGGGRVELEDNYGRRWEICDGRQDGEYINFDARLVREPRTTG